MMDYSYGGFSLFFILVLIILIIGVTVWLISLLFPGETFLESVSMRTSTADNELPIDIIKKRYAGGEITKEDYEEMRNEIQSGVSYSGSAIVKHD